MSTKRVDGCIQGKFILILHIDFRSVKFNYTNTSYFFYVNKIKRYKLK